MTERGVPRMRLLLLGSSRAIFDVEGEVVTLRGLAGARFFRGGRPPVEAEPACRVDALVAAAKSEGAA